MSPHSRQAPLTCDVSESRSLTDCPSRPTKSVAKTMGILSAKRERDDIDRSARTARWFRQTLGVVVELETVAFRAEIDADQRDDDHAGDRAENDETTAEQQEGLPCQRSASENETCVQ